jgi:thiamine pyrophosphate-dependent acetolactate synthase large subunit-like protein
MAMEWGSDAIAATIRDLGFKYITLVPGSSFAGLHDSLVNFLHEDPPLLVCLHEEHAVGISHGYARVTGEPMLSILHSNVGLMHATMAFFSAWCDRMPVVVIGANGPLDARRRRPWIDWIHSARDPAAMIRHYTKWDDMPMSVEAGVDALVRAKQLASTLPMAPTFVVLDMTDQDQPLAEPVVLPDKRRFQPPELPGPTNGDVERVLAFVQAAQRPVLAIGRCSRNQQAWDDRVAFAEAIGAQVITDFKAAASFPTDHPLHVGRSAVRLTAAQLEVVRAADLIISLESVDLGGMLTRAFGNRRPPTIVNVALDRYVFNGWSFDHQAQPPADLDLALAHERLVPELLRALEPQQRVANPARSGVPHVAQPVDEEEPLGMDAFAYALESELAEIDHSYSRLPLGYNDGAPFTFRRPLDYLGSDGGAGVGIGPSLAIGAALALRGTGCLSVGVLGDGDYLMGVQAIWTAVKYGIPVLLVICNNRCYYNDVIAGEAMALRRNRPVENKWVGQMIDEPAPDIAALARAQGAEATGPVTDVRGLRAALRMGIERVCAGGVFVIDAIVDPEVDKRRRAAAAALQTV